MATKMVMEVRELSELVAGQLADDEEVAGFTSSPATTLGENYGSTMLALDITIRKKKGADGEVRAAPWAAHCATRADLLAANGRKT